MIGSHQIGSYQTKATKQSKAPRRSQRQPIELNCQPGKDTHLWQQNRLDVRQHTTLGDGDAGQQLVQLLVVTDGQLQMSRDDTGLLVVTRSVTGQLENLSGQVLQHGGQVDRGTGTNTLAVGALSQQTVDTTDLEERRGRRARG